MGKCITLDADVTFGCYYGDYSSCDHTLPGTIFFCVCEGLHEGIHI